MRLAPVVITASLLLMAACTDSDAKSTASESVGTDAVDVAAATLAPADTSSADTLADTLAPELARATFTVQPGTEQVAVLGAGPGTEITVARNDAELASGTVDEQGSLLFRDLEPGDGYVLASDTETSDVFSVADPADHPDSSFFANQPLLPAGGFGYITARDGTTLSANVVLPGPVEDGPYPTVVEYSGYAPSNPEDATFAGIYTTLGFAYVGVNMRGSGCSGGSFRYFETVQSLDGYDVIEAVAAQPWVQGNTVGMVGISYPGISQLFVAATRPPNLSAITPLSVLDDSSRSTLYPGGILNTGFAVNWTRERQESAAVYGQGWSKDMADSGDDRCADNQLLRLQNPDLLQEIEDNPFYSPEVGDSIAPISFVDRIEVPVFIAGAWQDEQTGGHFPVMLDRFTGAPELYVTLVNGVHTESLSPPVMQRYVEFLQLYVAEQVPDLTAAGTIASVLVPGLYGVTDIPAFTNRFDGMSYDEALAAFAEEPQVRLLVEQGGSTGYAPGTPVPLFTREFSAWPIPEAETTSWYLGQGGLLTSDAPVDAGSDEYVADPDAIADTYYEGNGSDIWRADVTYDWPALADGTGLGFVSEPFTEDVFIAGSGSVDLWIASSTDDTDLEVTVTEVRPDGTEVYVQSGWLRASHRALDDDESTELRPVQTHLEADAAPLPAGEFTLVRVELFPFAHPFRAGSSLRLTIDAPGGTRPGWVFDTIADGETVTVAHGGDTSSEIVLSVIPGVDVPDDAPPACGSLRAQPCRAWVPASNADDFTRRSGKTGG